jgi:biotin transport system substrate-specific component
LKPLFPVSSNRRTNAKKRSSPNRELTNKVSGPNELLWALIGLLLTVFGTFIEAFTMNAPWHWSKQGIFSQSLGITYQIGAVLLTGCLGGKNAGALSQIAYVTLGLIWLPIFARGGGLDYLKEPSFGYLLGFIPGAWLCGAIAFRARTRLEAMAFSALCGLFVIHICGLIYLIALSFLGVANNPLVSLENLPEMIHRYSGEPLPGQLAIICVVAIIAFIIRQILFY